MLRKIINKLIRLAPKFRLKNKLLCFFYNNFKNYGFKASYNNGYFQYDFGNGILFNCYDMIFFELNILLKGYLKKYNIKKGDVIVDCGAYVGDFALYAAKAVGEKGKILAFEPDPKNYKKLLENMKLNSLSNLTVIEKGVWSSRTSSRGMALTSLDDELKSEKINFIKMDVEGAEIEAVKGAKNILRDNKVNLAIASYHMVNGKKTYSRLEEMLSEFDYETNTSYPEHLTTYAWKKIYNV